MRSGQFDSEKLFSSSVIDLLLFLALDRMKGESSRELSNRHGLARCNSLLLTVRLKLDWIPGQAQKHFAFWKTVQPQVA